MDISKFRNVGEGQFGRLRVDDDTVKAPNTTRLGKTIARIGDFFSRATTAGKAHQSDQNRDVRSKFADALKTAFPNTSNEFVAKLTDPKVAAKPLMAREMRAILSQAETHHKIETMRLTVPGHDVPVKVSPSLIPRSLLGVEDIAGKLNEKIQRGADLVGKLRGESGDIPLQPSKQDVSDIMWYLHMAAEAKAGTPFKAGAVTVDDPGGRIRQFLDKSDEVYQRKSSHIGGFQKVDGGAHRGIDFSGGANLDEVLPNGRATVLYGRVPKGTQQMPREMLFVKMESHGCRLATPSAKIRDEAPHGPTDRKVQLGHDLKAFFGHAFSFLGGIRERSTGDHAADSRKERINKNFIEGYETLVKAMPEGARKILLTDDPMGKSGGIRVMLGNIETLRNELAKFTDVDSPRESGIGTRGSGMEGMTEIDLDDEPPEEISVIETGTDVIDDHLHPRHMMNDPVVFTNPSREGDDLLEEGVTEPISTIFPEGEVVGSEKIRNLNEMLNLAERMIRESYEPDTINLRIGNEVILGNGDLPRKR